MCQIRCVNCTWTASFSWRGKEAVLWFESYGSKNLTGGTTWSSQSTSTDWLTRTHHWSSPRSKLSYKKPTSSRKLRKFLVTSGQGSKHRDWTAPRWWARWRSQSSSCQHHVITWRGLIPADHEYLDSVAWPCHDCEVAPVWHHDVTNARTCQFSAVCLTVFPFEFWPRTFTIGFYGKNSIISELMILECSFPLMFTIWESWKIFSIHWFNSKTVRVGDWVGMIAHLLILDSAGEPIPYAGSACTKKQLKCQNKPSGQRLEQITCKLLSGLVTGQKAGAKMVVRVAGSRFMQPQSALLCRFSFRAVCFYLTSIWSSLRLWRLATTAAFLDVAIGEQRTRSYLSIRFRLLCQCNRDGHKPFVEKLVSSSPFLQTRSYAVLTSRISHSCHKQNFQRILVSRRSVRCPAGIGATLFRQYFCLCQHQVPLARQSQVNSLFDRRLACKKFWQNWLTSQAWPTVTLSPLHGFPFFFFNSQKK